MRQGRREEVLRIAHYIVENRCTTKECAMQLGVTEKKVQNATLNSLQLIDAELYDKVCDIKRNNRNYRKGTSVVQLDYYDFSYIAEYSSVNKLAEDCDMLSQTIVSGLRNSRNGIYMSVHKEILVMKKETYETFKKQLGGNAND